jgi:hypothetical protein
MAQIRLTGVKAVVVILALAGFGVFRLVSARSALDTQGTEELSMWLRAEYASRYLSNLDAATITPEEVESLLALDRITFSSIRGNGTPSDMVVRVEIEVDGQPPPDGRSVRYWRMEHSMLTGWRMQREANVLLYYLNVF